MHRAIFLAMAVALQPAYSPVGDNAALRSYRGTMSGEALLRDYMGPKRPRDDPFLKGGDIVNQQMARAYMNGIKDATEGTAWCYVTGKSHELNDDIAAALMKLDPTVLKGRAAPLVVGALGQVFRCPPVRRVP